MTQNIGSVLGIAFALVALLAVGSGPSAAIAIGDYWTYDYHQTDPGTEWIGEITQRFASVDQQQILFTASGGGFLVGEANGTWTSYEVDRYDRSDGAFQAANSTLTLVYTELGQSYRATTETTFVEDPPVNLGGTLQSGGRVTATTNETVTQVRTVNGNTSGPTIRTTTVVLTERVYAPSPISVPAGTFNAWLIEYSRSDVPGLSNLYYNESVGNYVLINSFDATGRPVSSSLLKDYRYTRAGATPRVPSSVYSVSLAAVGATAAVVAALVWSDRRRPPAAAPSSATAGPFAPLPPRQP